MPRVVELFRKALEWQSLLQSGQVHNQAEIARREGINGPRVAQVMGPLRLTPRSSSTSCPCPTRSAGPRSPSGRYGRSHNLRTTVNSNDYSRPSWPGLT